MNKYIAVCYDEMARCSQEINRINRIVNQRVTEEDYDNAIEASKEISTLNAKKQVISLLIAKMEQID